MIDVSDDDEVEEVEVHDVDEESDDDEEVTPQPAKRKKLVISRLLWFSVNIVLFLIRYPYIVPNNPLQPRHPLR